MKSTKSLMLHLLTGWSSLQQFYMYSGLLIIYASINAFPLKTVVKLARIGTLWMGAGSANHSNCVLLHDQRPLLHDTSTFMSLCLESQAVLLALLAI